MVSSQLKEVQEELQELSEQSRRSDWQQKQQQRDSARWQEKQEEQQKIREQQEEELKELRYKTHLESSCHLLPPPLCLPISLSAGLGWCLSTKSSSSSSSSCRTRRWTKVSSKRIWTRCSKAKTPF